MIYEEEINKIESEDYDEPIPRARFPDKYKVNHITEIGELVYNHYGKNAPALIFAECFIFQSEMLSKGYSWHFIRATIKDVLGWAKLKGVNFAGIRTTFNKYINRK